MAAGPQPSGKADRSAADNVAVSVVIPCFNYGKYVLEAIDSVLASDLRDIEIIIVDDGSTDPGTAEILNKLDRPGTRVIRQANAGQAAARNAGISSSRGRYILCLDADDAIAPDYLGKAFLILEADPRLGFVYPHLQVFGDENFVWRKPDYNFFRLLWENHVPTAAVFRREAWVRVGGYKSALDGLEDWEFWINLGEHGWFGRLLPEPLFRYRRHGLTMLERSRAKRDELLKKIREAHRGLYQDGVRLKELRREWSVSSWSDALFGLSVAVKDLMRSKYFPLRLRRYLIRLYYGRQIV